MARPLLGSRRITLRRFAAGSRGTTGRYTKGPATDTTILASVQPVPREVMATLEEGDRRRQPKMLFTRTEIKVGSQFTSVTADHVIIKGVEYELRQAGEWDSASPRPHFEAIALRIQEGASA